MKAGPSIAVLTICLVLVGAASASASDPRPPGRTQSSTAALISDAPVYKHPGDAKRIRIASALTSWTWSRTVLLVLRSERDSRDRLWLKVLLPVRPNESAGWILAEHAKLAVTRTRVEISLRARALRVRLGGRVAFKTSVVIGAPATPTPRGLFAIYERAESEPHAVIGPFALHLTAFSDVLHSYDGGPGRVAIHGRSGALLSDPLGSASSHGCVRINNSALRRIAKYARPGAPVSITNGWPS